MPSFYEKAVGIAIAVSAVFIAVDYAPEAFALVFVLWFSVALSLFILLTLIAIVIRLGVLHKVNGANIPCIVMEGGKECVKIEAFTWVNTVLGNVKNALTGTYHAIRKNHASRYLAEFEYRFNRHFDLPSMLNRLLFIAVKTSPIPNRFLKIAEGYG